MILMRANPLLLPLEGVSPENRRDFFGPWNGNASEASAIRARKKLRFSVPTPSNGPSNGFVPIRIITSKRHIKKHVHWWFCVHEFGSLPFQGPKVLIFRNYPFQWLFSWICPLQGGGGEQYWVYLLRTAYPPPWPTQWYRLLRTILPHLLKGANRTRAIGRGGPWKSRQFSNQQQDVKYLR